MEKYRPQMKKYYYDPSKYDTYLEQLGIKYPTVRSKQHFAHADADYAEKKSYACSASRTDA